MGESVVSRIRALTRDLGDSALDLLFPPQCVGCGRDGAVWCGVCRRSARTIPGPHCPQCDGLSKRPGAACIRCQRHPTRPRVRSIWSYEPPISRALLHLKYRPDRRLARALGRPLAAAADRAGWSTDLVVPVPLGPARLRERGFNQAALLAAECARELGAPFSDQILIRHRETRSQVGLDPPARAANVRGAFRAARELNGERIVVVDDLYTTGATLRNCGRALLLAGAGEVCGLTVARAAAQPDAVR